MIARGIVVLALAAMLTGVVLAVRWWAGQRLARLRTASASNRWAVLGESPDGRPAIIAFSTPGCAACRTAQQPALEAVADALSGGVRILKVDLAERPEVGTAFGVLTAPTTIVLAPDGRIGSYNNGFAPADRLTAQVNAAGAERASLR